MSHIDINFFISLDKIQSKWHELFSLQSRTSFCSLSWHQVMLKLLASTFLTRKIYKLSYFEANKKGTNGTQEAVGYYYIKTINKKQTLVFGPVVGPSDYFDFVCNGAVDASFLHEIILKIAVHTQVTAISFNHIQKNTVLFDACNMFNNLSFNTLKCVSIAPKLSYQEHIQSLSKNAKQNLRTAHNRLLKSELPYEIAFLTPDNKDQIDFKALKKLYKQRNAHKKQHITLKSKLYKAVDHLFQPAADMFDLEEIKKTDFLLGILKIEGTIAAYFFGLQNQSTIEINRVTINNKFKFYSPGMILIDAFIKKSFELDIKTIDLTIGDEKYKYDLGGQTHEIISATATLCLN